MSELLLPPEIQDTGDTPSLFLAGPIEGTWDWQSAAIDQISADPRSIDIAVASPRLDYDTVDVEFDGNKQKRWEKVNYQRAARHGAVLFWLAAQTEPGWSDDNRQFPRSYAQTSRYELADVAALGYTELVNFVVGIEDGFSGANYIKWRRQEDYPYAPLTDSLEQTVDEALNIIDNL